MPLFHSFGYLMLWLGACRGMGLVCHVKPQEAGHGRRARRAVPRRRSSSPRRRSFISTPGGASPAQFGSLRLVVAGAEKLPESLARAFEDTFGIRPLEGYGMTECSPVVAVNALDFRAPGFFQPGSRRGTVGHPLPGVSVRVVRPESIAEQRRSSARPARTLPADTEGMILVKGPNVMQGYLGRDDLTRKALCDGWYVTGDLGPDR